MPEYLRLLDPHYVYDGALGVLVLGSGETTVPAKKTLTGCYIPRTRENQDKLYNYGHSYISGTLTGEGEDEVYYKSEPKHSYQVFVDYPLDLGISLPAYNEGQKIRVLDQLETFSQLLERKVSSLGPKIVAVPFKSPNSSIYYFELFQYTEGFGKGVHLVHRELGIVRVVIRYDFEKERNRLNLEIKYPILKPRQKLNTDQPELEQQ